MNLTRYEPWRLFDRLRNQSNNLSLFDDLLNESIGSDLETLRKEVWSPAVDVKEQEDQYTITADLPGVDPKDIEVTAENGVLSIKGQRSEETEDKQENYTRRERSYGSYYRSFSLPDNTDTKKIEANVKDGVLVITLQKKAAEEAKRIKVKG